MANGDTQFTKVGGAFFQKSDEGLQAVADPETLRGLQSGDISANQATPGNQDFASTIATDPPEGMSVPEPDSSDTDATRGAQGVLDATPETMLAQIESQRQQRLEENRTALEEARSRRTELTDQAAQVIEDAPSQTEIIEREREELGVNRLLDEQKVILDQIRGLRQQAIDVEQERGEALATSEGRKAPIGFIRGEKARMNEVYDRRIATISKRVGAETAVLEASQGLVNQARGLIQDTVNAATYDTEMELKRVNLFMEENQQQINELDTEIQRDLKRTQNHWENRLAEERKEKEQIMNLMIETPTAGISIDDTLEEAGSKAATTLGAKKVEDVALKAAEAGASQSTVNKIRNADSVGQAISFMALDDSVSTSAAGEDFEIEFTPTNRRSLAGVGFTSEEVSDLEKSVNLYGTRTTLDTLVDDTNYSDLQVTRFAQQFDAMPMLDEIRASREESEDSGGGSWWTWIFGNGNGDSTGGAS